jgi:hypothetical protein
LAPGTGADMTASIADKIGGGADKTGAGAGEEAIGIIRYNYKYCTVCTSTGTAHNRFRYYL